MLPIKPNQELSQQPDTLLVKVPDPVYQIWWDSAYGMAQQNLPIEERQKRMFRQVQDWISHKYPQYGIVAFEDLCVAEADKISQRTGYIVTWGMYILLQIGGSMQPVNLIDKLLEEGRKQIGG